ncbi:MAG: hypothetical protein FK733_16990 [Asgard group archaeon]|nr:hypothetical protein [Asgard group archaeon]
MPEYIINDEWILKRVSKGSSSFSDWVNDLVGKVKESIADSHPEKVAELEESKKHLPDLVNLEEKLKKAQDNIKRQSEKIKGLGSIGGIIQNIGAQIESQIKDQLGASLEKSGIPGMDINVDLLTGKRKSLADALYDVAKDRGIDSEDILYLIKSLPDLESFLYSTSAGKFYRDHTEHQLRVAVLGDFILEQDFGQGTLLNYISDITEIDKHSLKEELWWITGLIHDIGYPLQKMTKSINYSILNQILKCYPMLDLSVIPFEITLSKENLMPYIEILEENLSKEAKQLIRIGAGLNTNGLPVAQSHNFVSSSNGHQEYNHSSEIELDHGVIGALSILKNLGTPEEIINKKDEIFGYIKVAQAIALHNFKDKLQDYNFTKNPLAFLLILIDEMQEWGRPISMQFRDSYFTTELKKFTLLDEIHLTIDEYQWLMAFKKMEAKKLINFDFGFYSQSKELAFSRLIRDSDLTETRIVLQDYDIELKKPSKKVDWKLALEEVSSELIKDGKSVSLDEVEKNKDDIDKLVEKLASQEIGKPREKLLTEFYIVI